MATHSLTDLIALLPQPTNLEFTMGRNWGAESTGFFGPIVGEGKDIFNAGFINNLMGGDGSKDVFTPGAHGAAMTAGAKTAQALAGSSLEAAYQSGHKISVNKRNAVIFQDLPFRDINLSWVLRPRNTKQSSDFHDAIKQLKAKSAPKLIHSDAIWDVSGCTFSLIIDPSLSILDEVVAGDGGAAAKTSLKKILFHSQEMVITNINVNYTPNGFWSQHKDGWPTQLNLSIALMETQLAYNQGGVLKNKAGDEVI